MKLRAIRLGLLAVLLFVSGLTFAASPVSTIQSAANRMVSQLERNKSSLNSNPNIIHRIVNSVLVPIIDVNRMAGSVVGRSYWSKASSSQRSQFIREFKQQVINTYSAALSSYNGDKVTVYPLRSGYQGKKTVVVKSVIVRKTGQRVSVNYNLVKRSSGWKVYDFSIEGVSIVQNYRSQFAGPLANGGLSNLIKQLKKHNRGS
jgi:phospholipid transport system substrate-binding protein